MSASPGPSPIGQRFVGRLQGFLRRVREEGVRAGSAAGVDLGRAMQVLPALDREAFRQACRVTLAKSPGDLARVDRVFDEYWSSLGPVPVPPPSEERKRSTPRERRGAPGVLPPRSRPPVEEVVRETVEGRYSPKAPALGHPLAPVPPERMRRYRSGARRFRRLTATLPGRRWERAPRGSIDLRRTARRGLRTAGEWIDLSTRDRALRRSDVLVLWDVSGSMREHTNELFALVHVLQRTIRRTRVFAFGHEIDEVTSLFRGQSYERALPELGGRLYGAGGGTQIAYCLSEFRRHWGAIVRPTTTVLFVSDGWDLGESPDLAWELED
ncbi:MAG: VWA domain-containing protein, partial [Thermoplasmata archaeon]